MARSRKDKIADLEAENAALRAELRAMTEAPHREPQNEVERTLADWLGHPPGIFDDPGAHLASVLQKLVLQGCSSCGKIPDVTPSRRSK